MVNEFVLACKMGSKKADHFKFLLGLLHWTARDIEMSWFAGRQAESIESFRLECSSASSAFIFFLD